MSIKVKIELQTAPVDYDYAAEVYVSGNSLGIILGNTGCDNPTSENILEAIKSDVEWELTTQRTKYSNIDWIVIEKAGA